MDKESEVILVISFVCMLLILIALMFTLFIIFNKRKEKYIVEREEAKRAYEKELAESRVEIQEQIMKNISWELHDNLGQLLSVSKMQLNMIGTQVTDHDQKALDDCKEVISEALTDIRQLSKILNNDYIKMNGLVKATELEVDRFNRLKYLDAHFNIIGQQQTIDKKDEVILFRIIQELLSNVIKHSRAKTLNINMDFDSDYLSIVVEDDGVGLAKENTNSGIGMSSIQNRANMLNATLQFLNENRQGLKAILVYPLNHKLLLS